MSTLVTMVGNIRRNLGETSANFYTNQELKQFVGEGFKHYFLLMTQEGDGYFETTTNLGFTAATEAVDVSALTPTFFHISALERNMSNGTAPLSKSQRRFGQNFSNSFVGNTYQPTYKLRGMNIILEPAPQVTELGSSTTGLKLDYVYMPTFPTSAAADAFEFDDDFPTVYEPMIEIYATIAALESKDAMGGVSDVQSFRGRLSSWEERFFNSLERSEMIEEVEYDGISYSTADDYY